MATPRARSARAVHRREAMRESFILIPCLFLLGGLVLAVVVSRIDELLHIAEADTPFFGETIDDAQSVVASIPGATLTFVGVVFSVALVALQLRSNQYSPRVLRGFIRARTSKVTLGLYLATFAYSFLTLANFHTIDGYGRTYVPVLSVLVCEVLALVSLVVFVCFVNAIIRSMRVSFIIDDIARETRRTIEQVFPPESFVEPEVPTVDVAASRIVSTASGVVAGVDRRALAEAAGRAGAIVHLHLAVGAYISEGETIGHASGGPVDAAIVQRSLVVTRERTLYQDPAYGLRQIVDIAIRALSPAVNDPTTGVQGLDRLTDLLLHAGQRHDPPRVTLDAEGSPRVVLEVRTFDDLCSLAYDEIRRYGADSPQIPRRMLDAFTMLRRDLPPARHPAIDRQQRLLQAAVDEAWPDADERSVVSTSDRLGLG